MKGIPVRSGRTGRKGWQYRYTCPITGKRKKRTEWYRKERDADAAIAAHLEGVDKKLEGLPDNSGWRIPYDKLVENFLDCAPIASARRRKVLKRTLERNELRLESAADLCNISRLSARCNKLAIESGATYVRVYVQQTLKQLSAWAAADQVIPHDPLSAWERLEYVQQSQRRAFQPGELRAILHAAVECDELLSTKRNSQLVFTALLLSGNRPTAVLECDVKDFDGERLHLPVGSREKKNGLSTFPPAFAELLKEHARNRRGRLFVNSPNVSLVMREHFRKCCALAYTRKHWPAKAPAGVEPIEVALAILRGCVKVNKGPKPKPGPRLDAMHRHVEAIAEVVDVIKPAVMRDLDGHDMYALKKTHISWARRLVSHDSVRLQVGRSAKDVDEKHYVDLVDPKLSSLAVWQVLTGERDLDGRKREQLPLLREATTGNFITAETVAPKVAPNGKGEGNLFRQPVLQGTSHQDDRATRSSSKKLGARIPEEFFSNDGGGHAQNPPMAAQPDRSKTVALSHHFTNSGPQSGPRSKPAAAGFARAGIGPEWLEDLDARANALEFINQQEGAL